MSDKIKEFYELVHGMNHGDLRRIAQAMTEHIATRSGSKPFDATDYRDLCDVLFDCASQELGVEEVETESVLTPSKAEAVGDTPAAAFRRKGGGQSGKGGYTGIDSVLNRERESGTR